MCRVFVSRATFRRRFFQFPRQRASPCVGLVLILLISLRLDRTHTRLLGLRAGNLIPPMDIVSVLVVCRRLFSLCLCSFDFYPGYNRAFGWPGVASLSSLLLSLCLSPAVDLCVRLGSCLLFFLRPRVFLSLFFPLCVCAGAPCQSPNIDSNLS